MAGALSVGTHLRPQPTPPPPALATVSLLVNSRDFHLFSVKTMECTGFYDVSLDSPVEDTDSDWEVVDPRYDAPQTPSSTGDEAPPRVSTDVESDADEDARSQGELVPRRKPGGYDSRVEQMLYENPELPILIVEAGKSQESGRYIVYTIKTGVQPHCAFDRRRVARD